MTIKPKNRKNFRSLIIDAIKKDENAIPGRAGETPISNLANAFEKFEEKEAGEAIEAIANLINNLPDPLPTADPKDFWFKIMFLSHYPKGEKDGLKDACFTRLFGSKALARNLQVRALQGYIGSHGTLDKLQLEALSYLSEEAPVLWLDAAVVSKLFEFAKTHALRLLKEGRISSSLSSIVLCLDSWKKSWPPEEDFFKIVEEFQHTAKDPETKEKLEKWIQRRKK